MLKHSISDIHTYYGHYCYTYIRIVPTFLFMYRRVRIPITGYYVVHINVCMYIRIRGIIITIANVSLLNPHLHIHAGLCQRKSYQVNIMCSRCV